MFLERERRDKIEELQRLQKARERELMEQKLNETAGNWTATSLYAQERLAMDSTFQNELQSRQKFNPDLN